MGPRNAMEFQVLATILDHLAAGRPDHAADVATQQIKALDQALSPEGSWAQAKHFQLVEVEQGLINPEEKAVIAKEVQRESSLRYGQDKEWPAERGKSQGKGKDKGWYPRFSGPSWWAARGKGKAGPFAKGGKGKKGKGEATAIPP